MSAPQIQPDLTQRLKRIGHESLAASLVNLRLRTIRDHNIKPDLTSGQRGSDSSWTTANDEYICLGWCKDGGHHFNRMISRQNPGPMAISTPKVPSGGLSFIKTSSRTRRTEADERLPNCLRQFHDRSRSLSFKSSVL